MNKMKGCCGHGHGWATKVAHALVIIGGINWGLVGVSMFLGTLSNWNLVELVFGNVRWLVALIYVLVGISAIVLICGCRCKKCRNGVCEVHGVGKMPESTGPQI